MSNNNHILFKSDDKSVVKNLNTIPTTIKNNDTSSTFKSFFSSSHRRSSSKSSTKFKGLKDLFHLSSSTTTTAATTKKDSLSKCNSNNNNNNSSHHFNPSKSTPKDKNGNLDNSKGLFESSGFHDSLFLHSTTQTITKKESNSSNRNSNVQSQPAINSAYHDNNKEKRRSVQLLLSPTSKKTDIRIIHNRPLSLAIDPTYLYFDNTTTTTTTTCLQNYPSKEGRTEKSSKINKRRLSQINTNMNENGSLPEPPRLTHHQLTRQRSMSPIVISLHKEHAEPTFIRTTEYMDHTTDDDHSDGDTDQDSMIHHSLSSNSILPSTSSSSSSSISTTHSNLSNYHHDYHHNNNSNNNSNNNIIPISASSSAWFLQDHSLKLKSKQKIKQYKSETDLKRLKSMYMPSQSSPSHFKMNNNNNNNNNIPPLPVHSSSIHVKKSISNDHHQYNNNNNNNINNKSSIHLKNHHHHSSDTIPNTLISNQHKNNINMISSVLKPFVLQHSKSARLIQKASCFNLRESYQQSSNNHNNKNESNSWNLLKHVKKNQSSTALRKMSHDHQFREKRNDLFSQDSVKKTSEGSILHLSENGQDVLTMEMINGKFRVVAGTAEKLFLKLADETAQDFDYVDAYILNHSDFTTSEEFLENLMARFHIEPQPDETEYFKKWQHCIQTKVLNVISRWVKLQYQDFKSNPILLTRLQAFINGDITRGGFVTEANDIRDLLESQLSQHKQNRHSILRYQSTLYSIPSPHLLPQEKKDNNDHHHERLYSQHSLKSSVSINSHHSTNNNNNNNNNDHSNQRHHSSNHSITSPPLTPLSPTFSTSMISSTSSITPPLPPPSSSPVCPVILYEAKQIAQYLTLADFYLLKCITTFDYLHGPWRKRNITHHTFESDFDYIDMMTKRTNMLSRWVNHEICSQVNSKHRQIILKKLIEVAKYCLDWNNFHTSMIITTSLIQPSIQKLEEWTTLPNRELCIYQEELVKLVEVTNNMMNYRHALAKASSPMVPFFPLSLKDLTFYMDGNHNFLSSSTHRNHTSSLSSSSSLTNSSSLSSSSTVSSLINFAKYQSLTRCVHGILGATIKHYHFSTELSHWPFIYHENIKQQQYASSSSNLPFDRSLDELAFIIEQNLRE
ncbi:unnamed protein product [Cunninghamella blakesleeana]